MVMILAKGNLRQFVTQGWCGAKMILDLKRAFLKPGEIRQIRHDHRSRSICTMFGAAMRISGTINTP